ncbi:MAG: CaiB/BaiF CoA transferase family protein [Acidimicrobiia bacterium]
MSAVNDPSVNVFDGVRVVEFAQFVFVPSAGALLADWGADVIKIEHPVTGDGYRGLATQGIVQTSATGVNQNMEMHNRGKRSIGLDASKPEGRELLLKLVESADVFLTNFLPSALKRWDLDVDDLRAANPKIIYVRGHGHGVRGPDADMPAYDSTAYWSRGGLAETLKPPGLEHPLGPRGGFGDRLGGVNLAFGIAGALYRRERTGEPSVVDVSLLGTAVWTIASDMLSALQGNWRGPAQASSSGASGASAATDARRMNPNPLGGSYRTKDGRFLGLMLLQPDRHWPDFARAIGREDLLADTRFVNASAIFEHASEMVEILEPMFLSKTLDEWRETFLGARFPWAPYAQVPEVLVDPQVVANGYIQEIEHPGGDFRVPAGAVQFDELPARLTRGPEHAEHTELVLLEVGYDWDDIAKFKEAGVIT